MAVSRAARGTCCAVVALALGSSEAWAQNATAAGALFDKGVADMKAGRLEQACPAIEESQNLDPRPGTLFTLAECEAKRGRVATAVTYYEDYLGTVSRLSADQKARHRDRVKTARKQVTALKPTVPTLTLVLPPNAPVGTTVKRGGLRIQGPALDLPLPVDPGEQVVVTQAPGGPEHSITVRVALGEAKRLTLDVVPASPAPPATSPRPSAPAAAGPGAVTLSRTLPPLEPSSSRTPAYVAGGVGLIGLAVGSVTGLMVLSKKSTVDDECTGQLCSEKGVDAADSGKSLALVSNVGFGVGIAGLATGLVLLLVERPRPEQAVREPRRWAPVFVSARNGASAGVTASW